MTTGNLRLQEEALREERTELTAEFDAIIAKEKRSDEDLARVDYIEERVRGAHGIMWELDALSTRREWERNEAEVVPTGSGQHEPPDPNKLPTPFRSLGEQLHAVVAAYQNPHNPDPGLGQIQMAVLGASEGVSSDAGFLVQVDFTGELLRLVHETGNLSQRTDRKPIGPNSNGLKINAVDETSRVDGSRWGGVQAYWTAEAAALTATKPKYRQMELSLQKLTGLYYATDEVIKDTTALGAFIQDAFAEEFGFKIDDAIYRGAGSGMPLGVLAHAGTIDVPKETGQSAATILAENVEAMYARMWARSMMNAEWYINQDCWPQIFQLHHVIGTGGVPMFVPAGGLSSAPFGTLLGRPITPIEQCESVGTSGDIMFGDLSQYLMIEKGGIEAATSIHVEFLTDQMTFRFILRADGQPKRNAALTPYKGTKTQSSFITLADRA